MTSRQDEIGACGDLATREIICNFLVVACACIDFHVHWTLDVQYYSTMDLDGPGYFSGKYGLEMDGPALKWTQDGRACFGYGL
jgi:hypothetical protein